MAKTIAAAPLALSLSLSAPLLGQGSGEPTFGHYTPSYDKVSEYQGYSTFIRASDGTRHWLEICWFKVPESSL